MLVPESFIEENQLHSFVVTEKNGVDSKSSHLRRSLSSTTAAQSTVSGTGIANHVVLSSKTVTVTAKDASSTNIGTGGDLFYIQITNQCTKTSDFAWTVVGGADNTLSSSIFTLMTDNYDGTYTYSYTMTNDGVISVSIILFNRFKVLGQYYLGNPLSGSVVVSNYSSSLQYNWLTSDITSGHGDYVSAVFQAYIKAPITGTITFTLSADDGADLYIDGVLKINHYSAGASTDSFSMSMTQNQYYYLNIKYGELGGSAAITLYWAYSGVSQTIIPSTSYYYPQYVSSSPYTITLTCPTGYSGTIAAYPNQCYEICGDGKRIGNEKWDDGNANSGDGWDSTWRNIEASYVCSGGSSTTSDTWTLCTSGLYQNDATNPTLCVTHWGDSKKAGSEKCDDGNTVSGDGCQSDCTAVETGWVCSGGTVNARDTCTFCTSGLYQNDATTPTTWVPHWGDSLRAGSEKCDDGNTANSDGCKGDWTTVDAGWVWSGGSTTTRDTCTFCTSGFYQNDATTPTVWVTHWGDSLRAGTEKWDDGNTANGDGCKGDCSAVESSWVWSGGTTTSRDTWTFCLSGWYQNDSTNPTIWVSIWGDGKEVGTEKCDDGNTISGDGWKGDCSTVESSWVWSGGSSTTKDVCNFWTSGWYQNSSTNPEAWITRCGDGFRVGSEVWDDSNTKSGDGCSSSCLSIEDLYIWYGGSATSKDKCETWPFDYEPNSDKSKWVPKSISNSSKNIGIVYISLVFGAALMNFLTSVTSKTTHRSIYDMVNQAQLFILLPWIGMYVPEALVEFNRVIKDGLVSFSYISNSFMPQLFSFVSSSNYSQGDSYLYLVDLTSGSSVYNTSGLYFVLFVLLLFHFASWIINDLSLKELSPKGCLKLSYYIINYLSFWIYIRLFLLSFMFILLSTFTETFNSTAMKTYKASYSYSCTILVFSVIAMIVIFIKCIIFTKDGEADSATYSKELFRGIKPTKLSRVYYAVFLFRRLLFVTIICSSSSLSPKVKLLAISGLEVIYIIYLFAARPFLSIKDTISDIFNEISWLAILSVMIYYINGDKWSNTASNSVMAIIMINISIHVLISIGKDILIKL